MFGCSTMLNVHCVASLHLSLCTACERLLTLFLQPAFCLVQQNSMTSSRYYISCLKGMQVPFTALCQTIKYLGPAPWTRDPAVQAHTQPWNEWVTAGWSFFPQTNLFHGVFLWGPYRGERITNTSMSFLRKTWWGRCETVRNLLGFCCVHFYWEGLKRGWSLTSANQDFGHVKN